LLAIATGPPVGGSTAGCDTPSAPGGVASAVFRTRRAHRVLPVQRSDRTATRKKRGPSRHRP